MASSSASSAAKPACPQLDSCSVTVESTTLTLTDVVAKLLESPRQKDAEGMLEDIAVLQQWKETNNPSHEVRDAMAKLGPRWKVRQKENGKKRPPGEVARDIEESLLDKAKVMFNIC